MGIIFILKVRGNDNNAHKQWCEGKIIRFINIGVCLYDMSIWQTPKHLNSK